MVKAGDIMCKHKGRTDGLAKVGGGGRKCSGWVNRDVLIKAAQFFGNQRKLALAIGASPVLVNQWMHQSTTFRPEWAVRIEKASRGAVLREELLPDVFDRSWSKRNPICEAN